ncbi:mitochondrial carrier domain-containing protein [Radiomyces spectabilis]|uniref:mitochondrial carrier domain-containing protein n=1 Tax=Radiomyces spectabilis TaxID=64574 RepID=UPI00221F9F0D|nr:mitochondrial carrier domain-containing protein [Radiomyces spectabilis]KAI8368234.1 mitochondrial carrier domain-containing protein [Radiomyces spectabilis]
MATLDTQYSSLGSGHASVTVNPHRPYYTPGLHHEHNYTSISSNDTISGLTADVLDAKESSMQSFTTRFTSFATYKYCMTMLTSPFEVGTTLLQVQYSPHEDVEVIAQTDGQVMTPTVSRSASQFLSDVSSSEDTDDDAAFYSMQDRQQISIASSRKKYKSSSDIAYLVARSVYDEEHRPIYQMAPMDGGVLEILRHIMKQPTEGWKSLFKGQRVTWIYEILRALLQPTLQSVLNDIFGLYDDSIPLMHLDSATANVATLVVSHLVVGVLLSPLEIIRTRLIVQSASPLHYKYKGILHALRTMCSEEGGLRSVYLSINLIPTILYHIITPLLSSSTPLIVDRLLHISASDSPIFYGAAELALQTMGLIVKLPLETIRKRLHCQVPVSSKDGRFRTAVAIRTVPYKGVLDALYKIMKEEGTKTKRSTRPKQVEMSDSDSEEEEFDRPAPPKSNTSAWGIRGLYRGFGMQLAANIMVFISHMMNGIEDDFDGII